MTYPFEQVKNYTREFINIKDKEEFSNLRQLILSYDEKQVDQWFKDKASWLKIKGKENLAKAIGNASYYFAVSGKPGMSREEIENLEYKQILVLLKHFKLEEQLIILGQQYTMQSEDIFSLLYKTAKEQKKEEAFYSSRIILDPLLALFSKHEFEKLKKFESIIEKNMVDLSNNKVAFFIENGASYFTLKNNYAITDEIMFNYSDQKKEFIESYGKKIPLKEKAYQLLEDITNNNRYRDGGYLSQADYNTLNNIRKHISVYRKAVLYFDLKEKLPEKNISSVVKKI